MSKYDTNCVTQIAWEVKSGNLCDELLEFSSSMHGNDHLSCSKRRDGNEN